MYWLYYELVLALVVILFSFIFHEVGHVFKARELGYKVKAGFNKLNFEVLYWPNVNQFDDIKILEAGVFIGFFISLISVFICTFWSPLVLIVYYVGSRYDLQRLKVLYKHVNRRNI